MLFSTIGQGWVFLWMAAAGAVIAAWYALLAGLRRLLAAGLWLSLAADIAFGIGAAAVFCAALTAANYGRVRLYAVLGAALGFALFAAGVYPPCRRAARAVRRRMRLFLGKIRNIRWIKVIFR